MENTIVNLILIDAFCQQLTDDIVYLWTCGVIGEASSIRHHTAVNALGTLLRHGVIAP